MASMKFDERRKKHDALEEKIMNIVRPFTSQRHLPDRWVSFGDVPCPFDIKTNTFVEDNSRNEYFWLLNDGYPVWIAYQNGDGEKYGDGKLYADWIDKLTWNGPFPASKNSTSGDNYYLISGGRELNEFLMSAALEVNA